MRKITVLGTEYRWKVGKKHVLIRGPDKFKLTPLRSALEETWADWDDYEVGVVTPAKVDAHIRRHIEDARW